MVSAWSCSHGLVLCQQKVDSKSNEITALPELLGLLDIKDSIISIDAMGCQKNIARKINNEKEDYILGLKGNQEQLRKEIEAWFHKAAKEGTQQYHQDRYEEINKEYGRIEVRRCQQIELDIKWLTHGEEWEGLTTAIKVERETHHNRKESKEVSYYISSLSLNAK